MRLDYVTVRRGAAAALTLGTVLATAPTDAQVVQSGVAVQQQALDRIEREERDRRGQLPGADYAAIPGGPVTLAEVLRNPDDVSLNYRYARTQVAEGNLRGAAATLERILLIAPDAHNVRLLYAFVLYRLDSLADARVQIDRLRGAELSTRQQAELDRVDALVDRRHRRTEMAFTVGGGIGYQTNANFAPDTARVDAVVNVFGTRVPVTDIPTTPEEDDLAWLGSAALDFRHDLGTQDRDELHGSLGVLFNEQVAVDETDYRTVAGRLGLLRRLPWADVDLELQGGHFRLAEKAFLNYLGVQLQAERDFLGGALRGRLRHRTTYEGYDVAGGTTPERTGPRFEFEAGARYRLASDQLLGGYVEFTRKQARRDWREYDRIEGGVSHLWLMGRRLYLRNALSYGVDLYDAADPLVSATRRRDEDLRYQIRLGGPLGAVDTAGMLPASLRSVDFSVSLEYQDAASNIQNFDYDNLGIELFLSKRFDL